MTDAKSAAEEEITKFHENYNGSNFKLIYNNFHSDLKKKNSSFEDFSEFITTVHNKLGLVSSTTNQAWEVNVNFGVDKTVIMQQETIFEHGTGFETFSFVIRDEKILLEGYNIISLNLTPEDFAPVITE